MYEFVRTQIALGNLTLAQAKKLVGAWLTQAEYDKLSKEFK